MRFKCIGTGSLGNCYLLESESGSQLMLECGVKYDKIASSFRLDKVAVVLTSHNHTDHILCAEDLGYTGLDVVFQKDLFTGRVYTYANEWKVMPVPVKHGTTPCNAYIIYNTIENKYILFATDYQQVRGEISDKAYDLALVECNYSNVIVDKNIAEGNIPHSKYYNHHSLEDLVEKLKTKQNKIKRLILIHTSNSGLLDRQIALDCVKPYAESVDIAMPNMELNF